MAESPTDSEKKTSLQRAGSDWWSLQPIRRPAIPEPADRVWKANPIDAFIKTQLEEKKLLPNPETDRRTYIRRVTLDLTGLLPTPEEVAAFLDDAKPQAAENLVDRLLASPAYGERWGRHWLDVVRFAESYGFEVNQLRPNAWPYRDYIVRAFNRDIPFSQFVLEQLAGDAIPRADFLSQAATGFLVGGPFDQVGNATLEGKLQIRSDALFDMVSTTSTAFLGLTVGCARCHDHKFDPISQRDFYRMQAVFAGVHHGERAVTDEPSPLTDRVKTLAELRLVESQLDAFEPLAKSRHRPPVNARRNVERFAPIEARFVRFTITATNDGNNPCIDELEIFGPEEAGKNLSLSGKAQASSEYPNSSIHKIAHLNDGQYGNGRSWISNEPHAGWARIELPKTSKLDRIVWGRDRDEKYGDRLATAYTIDVSVDGTDWQNVAGSDDRLPFGGKPAPVLEPIPAARRELLDRQKVLSLALAGSDGKRMVFAGELLTPEPTNLLIRGDVLKKGDEVGPAALHAIGKPWTLSANARDAERRRGLAEWLSDPENPLPARVMVNRIWHYHFGQGIVRTPSDFGFNGDRPSHPELLDWLAAEYRANGGKMKPLHRLIVLSKTYRQSSRIDPDKALLDAGNRLFWRFPSRRLEAEAIRDSILQSSGALDRKMGGPGYQLWNYSGYVIVYAPKPKLEADAFRRMVYQFKPRLQQDGTFGAFDCPDGTGVAPRRTASTTALQALNLLNDDFIHEQADRFAERLRQDAGADVDAIVRRAFAVTLAREPSGNERQAATRLVKEHGLPAFCRALFNASEFVMLE